MYDAIENGVGDGFLVDHVVPLLHGDLGGNDRRTLLVPVFDHIEQGDPRLRVEGLQAELTLEAGAEAATRTYAPQGGRSPQGNSSRISTSIRSMRLRSLSTVPFALASLSCPINLAVLTYITR